MQPMSTILSKPSCVPCYGMLGLGILLTGLACQASAADPELVGLLALATEPATAEKLDLNETQVERLYELLDRREAAALGVAGEVRDLSPEERSDRLRPLRVESQRLMAGVLTDVQLNELTKLAADEPNSFYEPLAGSPPVAAAGNQPPKAEVASDDELVDNVSADESSRDEPLAVAARRSPSPLPKPDGDGKLSFNFRYQPWQDVLDWFAEQSDLSLVLESPPSGTFNYTDSRRYTPAQASTSSIACC